MKGLNIESLVSLLNETCDPYCGCLVGGELVYDNTQETFVDLTENRGWTGWEVATAIANGRFRLEDKYVLLMDDPHEIYSFSTADELSVKIDADSIVDILNDWWSIIDSDIRSRLSGVALPLHYDRGDAMLDFEDTAQQWWDNLTDMEKFQAFEDTLE